MRGYVAFLFDPDDERALGLAQPIEVHLNRAFGQPRVRQPGIVAWASSDLDVTTGESGVLVGQVFGDTGQALSQEPEEGAQRLCRQAWGRYVAIWRDGSVLRSPLGFIDVFTWERDGLQVVSSAAPPCLDKSLPAATRIDTVAVARFLRREPQAFGLSPLIGVHTVAAGAVFRNGRNRQVWRWESFCRPGNVPGALAPDALRDRIDHCITSWAGRFQNFGCEVSGGLDSAIVADSLVRAGARPRLTVNYHEDTRGADERRYVADLARKRDLVITYVAKLAEPFNVQVLESAAQGLRPATAGLDAASDADLAHRLAEAGADAVFGGQGGDAVFYQMPSPLIGADPLFGEGRKDALALWADLARWQGSTVWSVVGAVAGSLWADGGKLADAGSPLTMDTRRWRRRAPGGITPAKALQGDALYNSQAFLGPCRRAEAAALIHPLLSQPIVEHCLAIPASLLTGGTRDRALVREAFKTSLPASIVERKSKGLLSSYYARHVAANAGVIGQYLATGRLVQMELVDPAAVRAMLEPGQMIQRADLSVLLTFSLMEAWVRVWEGRLAARR
ncbi:asparagine synthase C-terminal domain-containing protein [Caulobacter sp. 73W]|uniref:Asparagine synthase C-terminal domain-containing protein n=1 Tax=Caulobacter sp. 73W TaxID=3161137 RepID=A0AB39KX76_9CAUL